jgi:hypothetical protein
VEAENNYGADGCEVVEAEKKMTGSILIYKTRIEDV